MNTKSAPIDLYKIKTALISVSDKSELEKIAIALAKYKIKIISTGGTAKALNEMGLNYTPIEEITGNPEAFQGRMKTISFQIGSALLFRRDSENDIQQATDLRIPKIDLVICNFYPFDMINPNDFTDSDLVEWIDIGGPTMVRAAAKNFQAVSILTSPTQYSSFIDELETNHGHVSLQKRKRLALEAFQKTANYEQKICSTLEERWNNDSPSHRHCNNQFLPMLGTPNELRYGENPHQKAYIVPFRSKDTTRPPQLASAPCIQGKAMSYNNLLDADSGWKSCQELWQLFKKNGVENIKVVTIVKHNIPCGAAASHCSLSTLEHAWASDNVSAFGSIISFSFEVDEQCATFLSDKFIEVIMAPKFSPMAKQIFSRKKNLRLLEMNLENEQAAKEWSLRSVSGGLLVQEDDLGIDPELHSVTKRKFELDNMLLGHFGITLGKYLKSNAVCLVQKIPLNNQKFLFMLMGQGCGRPNRIEAITKLAIPQAKANKLTKLNDCLLISDAFFPFADSIEETHLHGIEHIIQPGGSIRDQEVIDACDKYNMSMAFTGRRHFRH